MWTRNGFGGSRNSFCPRMRKLRGSSVGIAVIMNSRVYDLGWKPCYRVVLAGEGGGVMRFLILKCIRGIMRQAQPFSK